MRRFLSLLFATGILLTGCQDRQMSSPSSETSSKENSVSLEGSSEEPTTLSHTPLYFVYSDPSDTLSTKYQPHSNTSEPLSTKLLPKMIHEETQQIYGQSRDEDNQVWLSRTQEDGSNLEQLVPKADSFSVVGDSLYYTLFTPTVGYQIYQSDLDGKNAKELPVGMLKQFSNFFIAEDMLYYTDAPYGKDDLMDQYHNIIVWDMKKQEAIQQIKVPNAHSLVIRGIWDQKIVYSDLYADGAGSGYCDIESGESFSLDTVSPKIMIAEDVLYYAGDGYGKDLWSWKAGEDAPKKQIEGSMGHFVFQEGWIYFCPDDSYNHWQRYSVESGEIQSLPEEVLGMPIPHSQKDSMPANRYDY